MSELLAVLRLPSPSALALYVLTLSLSASDHRPPAGKDPGRAALEAAA
jgi:hypothetical protein